MTQVRIAPHLLAMLVTASAVMCSPAMASGQWKWRDASGSIQYSDRPPPQGTPESAILSRPRGNVLRIASPAATPTIPATPSAAASTASATDPELEAKRRKAEQEEQAKRKAEEAKIAKQKAENCTNARTYQRTLDHGMRIARVNEKGEREILNDQQRVAEQRQNQEAIRANCQ